MNRRNFVKAAPLLAAPAVASISSIADAKPAGKHFDTVKSLILAWRGKDLSGVLNLCADDIHWYSHVGSPPINGKAAMEKFLQALSAQMNNVKWRIFHYAESGDLAFAEGVDEFTGPDGRSVALPYAGVLRFKNGKITEWRDYFDRNLFDRLKAGETPPDHIADLVKRTALF